MDHEDDRRRECRSSDWRRVKGEAKALPHFQTGQGREIWIEFDHADAIRGGS